VSSGAGARSCHTALLKFGRYPYEIRRGEGSNFLISRRGRAEITGFSPEVPVAIFRVVDNRYCWLLMAAV